MGESILIPLGQHAIATGTILMLAFLLVCFTCWMEDALQLPGNSNSSPDPYIGGLENDGLGEEETSPHLSGSRGEILNPTETHSSRACMITTQVLLLVGLLLLIAGGCLIWVRFGIFGQQGQQIEPLADQGRTSNPPIGNNEDFTTDSENKRALLRGDIPKENRDSYPNVRGHYYFDAY